MVTNGVYQTGGRAIDPGLTNRVAVTKPLTLRSVNGPDVTVIRGFQIPGTKHGDGAIRCVYPGDGAMIAGFTLTNGATDRASGPPCPDGQNSGGGMLLLNAIASNCVAIGDFVGSRPELGQCRRPALCRGT